jgi:hypothetical protein
MISRNIAGGVAMVAMSAVVGFALYLTREPNTLFTLIIPAIFGMEFWKNK